MKKPVVAVIGFTGMVGGTAYNWLRKHGFRMMGLTSRKQTHTWDEINDKADWIIVAVPTPFDWRTKKTNLKILEETLGKIKPGKKVIHKCTVPPGTTEDMQAKFPKLKLLYNPEFLSEATCDEDFSHPDRQIMGYTAKSYEVALEALQIMPESPYSILMKATESEICKFINNVHGALMVMFANQFYDISQQFKGLDFDRIKEAAAASKWVGSPMGRMYWDVHHGGFRGYGGSCFPKDVNMIIDWCRTQGVPDELLEATRAANRRLLRKQGMTEIDAEKISSAKNK